jgi:predicted ATPase
MADRVDESTRRVGARGSAGERLKLQTNYGVALSWAKGYAAPETAAAFDRARELAGNADDLGQRFAVNYGEWTVNVLRGELGLARRIAAAMLGESKIEARLPDLAVAHRVMGLTFFLQGEFIEAKNHIEEALRLYDPRWDRDTKVRVNHDTGSAATLYLALGRWLLGEVDGTQRLAEQAATYAVELDHVRTLATVHCHKGLFEAMCQRAEVTLRDAETLDRLCGEHAIPLYLAIGGALGGWARARLGDLHAGATELRHALVTYSDQGNKAYIPFFQGLLAEIECAYQNADAALERVDEALILATATGEHWSDAFLHRMRGDILLKRNPENTAPAEEAFFTAIGIAQQQRARSFELRAALSLAKLYQSNGRAADAYAVLTPALEGFSPTPEFPEIAEALLAALAETGEVKKEAAQRQRRLKLQTSYGQALQWSKGYVAEEATAAFKRAQELAAGTDDDAERFKIHQGHFVASFMRAELRVAQEIAETLLRGAGTGKRIQEAAAAQSMLGLTLFMQGAFADARASLEEALSHHDRNAKIPVAIDTEVGAKISLAYTFWVSGDFARARDLINESVARSVQIGDPPNQCTAYSFKSRFEMLRGDAEGAGCAAENLLEVSQEYETKLFLVSAEVYGSWARTRLHDRSASAKQFQQALVAYADQGNKIWLPLYQGRLAEIEADGEDIEEALARIDGALALVAETREHWSDSLLHRIRGEILLKRDPTDTATAEEAFLTAIAVAQQQKAKTFELRAALALAKLYQSESRAADAHAVLAPALAGFSPTPELPQIEEAQTLLGALAETDEVKSAVASRERRLKLQTAYGLAVAWSRGFAAEETKATFARAHELTAGSQTSDERFTTLYGQWVARLQRAELDLARETAETFLREAVEAVRMPETVAAHRYLGLTCLCQGQFVEAQTHLEEVLRTYDPSRDRDTGFRFGTDSLASAKIYLAYVCWQLADFVRARELSNEAIVLAKLYQTTNRTAEARAVLAPALEALLQHPSYRRSKKHKRYTTCFPLQLLTDDLAERHPAFAVELFELQLVVAAIVGRTRVHLDTRQ